MCPEIFFSTSQRCSILEEATNICQQPMTMPSQTVTLKVRDNLGQSLLANGALGLIGISRERHQW